jgi:hypothetical protein
MLTSHLVYEMLRNIILSKGPDSYIEKNEELLRTRVKEAHDTLSSVRNKIDGLKSDDFAREITSSFIQIPMWIPKMRLTTITGQILVDFLEQRQNVFKTTVVNHNFEVIDTLKLFTETCCDSFDSVSDKNIYWRSLLEQEHDATLRYIEYERRGIECLMDSIRRHNYDESYKKLKRSANLAIIDCWNAGKSLRDDIRIFLCSTIKSKIKAGSISSIHDFAKLTGLRTIKWLVKSKLIRNSFLEGLDDDNALEEGCLGFWDLVENSGLAGDMLLGKCLILSQEFPLIVTECSILTSHRLLQEDTKTGDVHIIPLHKISHYQTKPRLFSTIIEIRMNDGQELIIKTTKSIIPEKGVNAALSDKLWLISPLEFLPILELQL